MTMTFAVGRGVERPSDGFSVHPVPAEGPLGWSRWAGASPRGLESAHRVLTRSQRATMRATRDVDQEVVAAASVLQTRSVSACPQRRSSYRRQKPGQWCVALLGHMMRSTTPNGKPMNFEDRIAIDPAIRSGKPCIKGTRITVYDILEYLAGGMSKDELIRDFPDLIRNDVHVALAFAAPLLCRAHRGL